MVSIATMYQNLFCYAILNATYTLWILFTRNLADMWKVGENCQIYCDWNLFEALKIVSIGFYASIFELTKNWIKSSQIKICVTKQIENSIYNFDRCQFLLSSMSLLVIIAMSLLYTFQQAPFGYSMCQTSLLPCDTSQLRWNLCGSQYCLLLIICQFYVWDERIKSIKKCVQSKNLAISFQNQVFFLVLDK